ncbi:hypothetical protein CRU88_11160 [Arcobacter sp. CECT 9188]|nr:hypothetical protein CRU88_11160 [Arcobacter sp. CECT 9188]
MIEGYKGLNDSITQTTNLISDIEMSSKEQLSGIEQINDAVNQLDRQTQQNAMISSQTHDIAMETDNIAKDVVKEADSKEFLGKDSAKAKKFEIKNTNTTNTIPNKSKKEDKKIVEDNSSNEDEWENF